MIGDEEQWPRPTGGGYTPRVIPLRPSKPPEGSGVPGPVDRSITINFTAPEDIQGWLDRWEQSKREAHTAVTRSIVNAMSFNRAQLITYEDAIALRTLINQTPLNNGQLLGGGIAAINGDSTKSGIYRDPWLPGPGNFPEPHYDRPEDGLTEYPYLFRFVNGAAGVNAGLIADKYKRYPTSPSYVINSLAAEINQMGNS